MQKTPRIKEILGVLLSEAEGTRTPNHRIDSRMVIPNAGDANTFPEKGLAKTRGDGETMSAAESAAILTEDADLQAVIEQWSDLPQTIKTAILALIRVGEEP
jgi:hypothetical protein